MASLQEPRQIAGFASTPGRWKPYPAYRPSGVDCLGEIPLHWEVKRLKFIASLNMGQSPSSEDYSHGGEGLPFLQGAAEFGPVYPVPRLWCPAAPKRAYAGDILLSVRAPVGALNVADQIYGIGRGLCAVRPHTKDLDPSYTRYLLEVVRTELASVATGSTYDAVSANEVGCLPCLLGSLDEQGSIAEFLDRETARIDALVAKKERLIELLQEKRAALITHAVTKGLNPSVPMKDSGVEWLGPIPSHWSTQRLKFMSSLVTSGSRGWAQHYSDEGAVFLRIGNLSRTRVDLQLGDVQYVAPPEGAEGRRTKVEPSDLLISITAYIGSVGVVPEGIGEAYVNQHLALTRLQREIVDPRWAAYCLLSNVGQPQFNLLLYGGTKDGLGLDDVRNLVLLLPRHDEQTVIVRAVDTQISGMNHLITKVQDAIVWLKEYRTALISTAVTGKIDVRQETG